MTSHDESAFVHATSTRETGHATPETESGDSDTLHNHFDHARELNGSGPQHQGKVTGHTTLT